MSEFIKQYQTVIKSADAQKLGMEQTKDKTGLLLTDFFRDIVATVMTDGDETYLIQWAISKLTPEEASALEEKIKNVA